jgi:hypothetical protein
VLVHGLALPPIRGVRSGASRLARKHVSFRRLQKLDSERHGAAAGVSNHDGSHFDEQSFDLGRSTHRVVAKAELDQDGVRRHDARSAGPSSPQ